MAVTRPPNRVLCEEALARLMQSCDGVRAVMLALRDGRPYAERHRRPLDGGKFAAMVSSLVGLGHTVLRELGAGKLDHVLVDGSEGKLVVASIPGSNGLLLLAVLADRDARMGLVLGHARSCAVAVSQAFPGTSAGVPVRT